MTLTFRSAVFGLACVALTNGCAHAVKAPPIQIPVERTPAPPPSDASEDIKQMAPRSPPPKALAAL